MLKLKKLRGSLMLSINVIHKTSVKLLFGLSLVLLVSGCQSTLTDKQDLRPVEPKALASYKNALLVMKSGQTQRALKLFNSIDKKYPGFAGPQLNIGLMHLKNNQLSKAEKSFRQAIKINRDNAIGYNLLGVVFRRSGKFIEAKEQYQLAISKSPNYANAHLNLGVLYDLYMSDLSQAIHHYEQYQKFSTSNDSKVSKWILDLKRRNNTQSNVKKGMKG